MNWDDFDPVDAYLEGLRMNVVAKLRRAYEEETRASIIAYIEAWTLYTRERWALETL